MWNEFNFTAGRHLPLLVALICYPICSASSSRAGEGTSSGNFACADAVVLDIAEQSRIRSARFWSGKELPGKWSSPCPIQFQIRPHEGGGQTQFRFENGEVFGWRMLAEGTYDSILQDVIPHEVDHMVRASLVRRPIERWLDEGCASLMESSTSHERLRAISLKLPDDLFSLRWLERREYPQSPIELEQLYAGGFSLVEFLLGRDTSSTLLDFQRDPDSVTARLARYYRLTPETLRLEWLRWRNSEQRVDCRRRGCRIHGLTNETTTRPVLIVCTAEGCPPCIRFHNNYQSISAFRDQLDRYFDVRFQDVNQRQIVDQNISISVFPTFLIGTRKLEGYTGPNDLLQRLEIVTPSPPLTATPPILAVPESPETSTAPLFPPVENSISNPSHLPPQPEAVLGPLPSSFTLLQWIGIVTGGAATGGIGGVALTALFFLLRHRSEHRRATPPIEERSAPIARAPFPRKLDEASQLLAIRQSEGRLAVLDALRGLFLDAELERFEQSKISEEASVARRLREAIDTRVSEVAPLTTELKEVSGLR